MTNPKIANTKPPILNLPAEIFSMVFNIFFIFDGNKAYKMPSIKSNKPKAITSSFIKFII